MKPELWSNGSNLHAVLGVATVQLPETRGKTRVYLVTTVDSSRASGEMPPTEDINVVKMEYYLVIDEARKALTDKGFTRVR